MFGWFKKKTEEKPKITYGTLRIHQTDELCFEVQIFEKVYYRSGGFDTWTKLFSFDKLETAIVCLNNEQKFREKIAAKEQYRLNNYCNDYYPPEFKPEKY